MAIEKRKGPSYRFRWTWHKYSLSRFRRMFILGPKRREAAAAKPARRFHDLKDQTSIVFLNENETRRGFSNPRVCATRRRVKARHGPVLRRLLIHGRFPGSGTLPKPEKEPANLFYEMLDCDEIKIFVRESRENGKALYAALCNVDWVKNGEEWGCSWRAAGRCVADLRNQYENYLDFYCSGNEGYVDPSVEEILGRLGWVPCR